jgi:hypothetical protein
VALLSFPLIATVVLVVFSCAAHLAHASSRFLFPSPLLAEVVMAVVEWIASMVIFKSSPPTVTTKGLVGRVAGSRLVIVDFRDAVDVCVQKSSIQEKRLLSGKQLYPFVEQSNLPSYVLSCTNIPFLYSSCQKYIRT